ncbi:winged helix-turn-helix transcriptional regulator [Streptomyces sp. NPDC005263]|uniref:winged helix-turn-helix transcriptional regulator n=1 Tax=Streptomyces sp. NPDC005263 TaxID=3364711 RepID=UPI00367EDC29
MSRMEASQERTLGTAAHLPVSDPRPVGRLSIPSADDPRCSVRDVLDRIADKWTALIITILAEGPIGYAELRRSAAGVSHKMLAQTLRKLERDGLVDRTVLDARPVRVTYSLTPFGETIVPPLTALRNWANTHGPELVANQVAWDQRTP